MDAPAETCETSYKHLFSTDLLRDKVAFITGGGTGIGFKISEVFMRHGCNCVIASRKLDRLQHAAKELERATRSKCLPVQLDVRKPQNVMEAIDKALEVFGKIDIVVNCAAGNFAVPLAGMSYNAFKTVLDIDTIGTFNVSKTAYDKYLKDHGGVILNITATLDFRGMVFQSHAGPAKAAINALTRHMATEWGRDKIRVVGLAPGATADTEGYRKLGGSVAPAEYIQRIIPVGRVGTRLEIAHASLFLVSEAASYVTGELLVSDGGMWLCQDNSMAHMQEMMSRIVTGSKM